MTDAKLPPEIIGHMAGIGGTNEPLNACYSCQRAIIYGVLAHLSSAYTTLEEGDAVSTAGHISFALDAMLNVVKLDMAGAIPGSDDMTDEDWRITMAAFCESRIDHYTDAETGSIVFEPHDEDGEPVGVAG